MQAITLEPSQLNHSTNGRPNMNENEDPGNDIARKNIRMAAALRGMNLSEVSRQANMSRNALGQYTSGRTSLSYNNMLKVCKVLQVPIGIMHKPDAITETKVRLWRALDRLPDHLAQQALAVVKAAGSENGTPTAD